MLAAGDLVAGKYRVERLLGEGGMGAVFVAVNERLRKRVALKILRPEVARAPGAAERFTREAIAASSAKHPGIIEIYDADVHDGLPWIAMELLEGESLGSVVSRRRLGREEALEIMHEAAAALAHVHRAGIVHRDLKPDNLFLEALPEGGRRVKLLDFGIAASAGAELIRVTQTGMAIGTPAYIAPEQAAGEAALDARVDVYAMGVILFELITGALPYRAGSLGEVVMRMYTVGPPSLAEHAPEVPPRLAALVDMCLVVDRERRVQSADAVRGELEAVLADLRGVPTPDTRQSAKATPIGNPPFGAAVRTPEAFEATAYAPAPRAPAPGWRAPIVAALAIGAAITVAAVAGLAFVMIPREPAPPPGVESPPAPQPMQPLEPVEAIAVPTPAADAGARDAGPPDAGAEAQEPEPRARRERPRRRRPRPEPETAPEARPLSDQTFMRVLARHEPDLDACYFRIYPERPRPQVRVTLDVWVDPLGNVTRAGASGGRPELAPCIRRVLDRMRFPEHPASTHIRSTITLYDTTLPGQ